MDQKIISQIFDDTAYVRTGGSPEELKTARYIQAQCARFGAQASIEAFQSLSGLPQTGELDKITWKQLALHYPLAANKSSALEDTNNLNNS